MKGQKMEAVPHLRKGRYLARVAQGGGDLARAQRLRSICFGARMDALDHDAFDALCTHVLIEECGTENGQSAALVACFRILPLDAAQILNSYSAQFYDLSALTHFNGPLLELGRFCIHPDHTDPDILRMAWGFLTRWVDACGVKLLFGCASFNGDQAALHLDAFAQLLAHHLAPPQWQPRPKAAEVFDFATGLAGQPHNPARAAAGIPPLLRTYLLMGGWVSDHAVFDHDLATMHVFTAVEIAAIPPSRARLLRALAEGEAVMG